MPTHAQSDEDRYTIMVPEKGAKPDRPEPWLPPKYKSPRGTRQHVVVPPPATVALRARRCRRRFLCRRPAAPCRTCRFSGPQAPRGSETYQDRAARCAHQAGVYGQAAGDRNAYIGGCINQ